MKLAGEFYGPRKPPQKPRDAQNAPTGQKRRRNRNRPPNARRCRLAGQNSWTGV